METDTQPPHFFILCKFCKEDINASYKFTFVSWIAVLNMVQAVFTVNSRCTNIAVVHDM